MDAGCLTDHFRTMVQICSFEEEALRLTSAGLVPGSVHPYTGHETIAVGVLGVRDPNEWVVPSSGAPLPPTRPSGSCTTRPGSGSTRSPASWRAPAPNLSAPRLPRACETSDEPFDRLAAKAFPLLGDAAESEIPATPAAARHHHPKEAA